MHKYMSMKTKYSYPLLECIQKSVALLIRFRRDSQVQQIGIILSASPRADFIYKYLRMCLRLLTANGMAIGILVDSIRKYLRINLAMSCN